MCDACHAVIIEFVIYKSHAVIIELVIYKSHVRDNVLSRGHYPKINPDGPNSTPTRSGGVLFRPEGISFCIMTSGQYIIPLIIRLLAKNDRRHSSKIPLFNDLVAVS